MRLRYRMKSCSENKRGDPKAALDLPLSGPAQSQKLKRASSQIFDCLRV
jgi:hypothetical protein